MEILILVGVMIVLAIIGAALGPRLDEREHHHIARLQRDLPPGRAVRSRCKGGAYFWT
jgi:hypothetical protein